VENLNEFSDYCKRIITKNDDELKDIILSSVVYSNLSLLRGGNEKKWNELGWYNAGNDLVSCGNDLVNLSNNHFPVPLQSKNWFSVEKDDRTDTYFRFFCKDAFLDLPAPSRPCVLSFVIAYVSLPEALTRLNVEICGLHVPIVIQSYENASAIVLIDLNEAMIDRIHVWGKLNIKFYTPISAIPAIIYDGSIDHRDLSLAITYPDINFHE
jgi:hypothetical protein